MTYSTLQTLNNSVNPNFMPFDGFAGDDASIAKALAERYQENGLDPAAAYDNPDDAIGDFGINGILQ